MNNNDKMYERIKRAMEKKPIVNNNQLHSPRYVIGRSKRSVNSIQTYSVPPANENTIYVSGSCIAISGYDNLVCETIKGLHSMGLDVRINANNNINCDVCPTWFKSIHMPKVPNAWEILITPPCSFNFSQPNSKSVILTMWETDELDEEWVKYINGGHIVCVPSQWAVDCFQKCGVKIPICKTPLGYDPLIFSSSDKFPEICTFGTAAALSSGGLRKNTDYIINLFQEAFPTEEDVRLKVKITPSCSLPSCQDSRVEITREILLPANLAAWYKSISVFVNGSYAEGFGLHLIEAMASGRPLISTAYSAVTEYFDDEVGWTVGHEIIPAFSVSSTTNAGAPYSGHWGKPIGESVIEKMRYVYNNQREIKRKGEAAHLRARNFMWKSFGQKIMKFLTSHGVIK